LSILDKLYQ
jgi:hypothetical protein